MMNRYLKVAATMQEEALLEATAPAQTYVPGSRLRDAKGSAQARGRATRTPHVRNEERDFNPKNKVNYTSSSRGGITYDPEHVNEINKMSMQLKSEHKDPKGGLSAKGRAAYNKATGSKLKPGVKGAANTPEKLRRKGSWATRFYCRQDKPPLTKPNGEPTRLALTARAWGEPVPKNWEQAGRICQKGKSLLEKYKKTKGGK